PSSSRTSRRSAASSLSPGSTPPPGNAHWPGKTPRSGAMRQSRTRPPSSVTTATTISLVDGGISGLGNRLNGDGRAVAEDLGHALQQLRGVVADADDRIGPHGLRMAEHHLERFLPRFLAELREEADVAAEDGLEGAADRSDDGAGPNGDAADHSQGPRDPIALDGESRRRHGRVHPVSFLYRSSIRSLAVAPFHAIWNWCSTSAASVLRFCATRLCQRPKSSRPSRGCLPIVSRKTASASFACPFRSSAAASDCRTG